VRRVMAKLLATRERLPYKKIDSTLRGNVGAETMGALLGSGRRTAVISPAAPGLGRQMRAGRLLLHGEPAATGDLVEMLRQQLPGVPISRLARGETVGSDDGSIRLFVADAEQESDLEHLVDLCLGRPDELLLVGSAGLAAALARRTPIHRSLAQVNEPSRYGRVLFIVGSRNPQSAAQVRALLAHGGVADLGLHATGGGALEVSRVPVEAGWSLGVLYVEGLEEAAVLDPQHTADQLAQQAERLMPGAAGSDLVMVMTGGDTARAMLARLGVQTIEVSRSLAPGVVFAKAASGGRMISIVTKAGGFGDSGLFTRLASELLEVR